MDLRGATARLREATYAVWAAEAMAHGGEVAEHDGILAWRTGVPVRYWNGAHVTAPPVRPEAALQWVARWFADRATPYGVMVPVELEPALAAAAGASGLRLAALQRCMALVAVDFTAPAASPPGLDVRRTGPTDVEDFLAVQVETFGLQPEQACAFLAPPVGRPGWTHLTGYRDGRPVVTAIGVRTGDAVGVFGVGTTVADRRRGYGAAVTAAVLEAEFRAGAAFAHLNPSELGAGVYRRLGFHEVGGFAIWLPASDASPEATGTPGG